MTSGRDDTHFQIVLHWLVILMMGVQFGLSDRIVGLWADRMSGVIPDAAVSDLHVVFGVMILLVALWRLVLVLRDGLPPLPAAASPGLRRLARALDGLFYIALVAMPASGAVAWGLGFAPAIAVHHVAEALLAALIVVNIAGAAALPFLARGAPKGLPDLG